MEIGEIYFEVKGEALLEKIGMSKAEFARRMGIQRQNVKALFKSKDLRVIQKAAVVMGVPWGMLVGSVDETDEKCSWNDDSRGMMIPIFILKTYRQVIVWRTGGGDKRLSQSSTIIGKMKILSIGSSMKICRIIYM